LGEVERRVGVNASFSLPTGLGDGLRLVLGAAMSIVLAWRTVRSSAEATESTSVASVESIESTVDEVMRGEERVSRPAWELWGEMPGRFSDELAVG